MLDQNQYVADIGPGSNKIYAVPTVEPVNSSATSEQSTEYHLIGDMPVADAEYLFVGDDNTETHYSVPLQKDVLTLEQNLVVEDVKSNVQYSVPTSETEEIYTTPAPVEYSIATSSDDKVIVNDSMANVQYSIASEKQETLFMQGIYAVPAESSNIVAATHV